MNFTAKDLLNMADAIFKDEEELKKFIEEIKPMIGMATDIVVDVGMPVIKKLATSLMLTHVDLSSKMFGEFCERGFSREEAMLLVLNSKVAIKEAFNKKK